MLAGTVTANRGSYGTAGTNEATSTFEYQQIADKNSKKRSAVRAQHYTDSMRHWLRANGYSTSLLLIADMGLNMNIKRFYAVNPDSQKLLHAALVSHGSGGGSTLNRVVFSNVPGSFCSSKGRYKIGETYQGSYGKSWRLHGLDAYNSNAFSRLIVLHAYRDMTEEEYDDPLYFSGGCPMLGKKSFAIVDALIAEQTKPVMLVIY